MNYKWGAVFDWDGVLVDSSRHHEESWNRLAEEEAKTLPPDHFTRGFGMKNESIIPDILNWSTDGQEIRRLSLRKEELYREVVGEWGITPLPGVVRFLSMLQEAGIPRAIASSTHRANIRQGLESLGLKVSFNEEVTAEDVHHGKPDPEVFIIAAKKLKRAASRCVVFEDAPVGVEAGLAAGMKVVAVSTTHSLESLGNAHRVVERLDELGVDEIGEWFS